MPKVKVTPNPAYDPLGVRILLSNLGVSGPMLQDETSITCIMTEDEINRFRNGRGAAHRVEIIPEVVVPSQSITPILDDAQADDEPQREDPTSNAEPAFPKTFGKLGRHRITVQNEKEEKAAKGAGYVHVDPDPLNAV